MSEWEFPPPYSSRGKNQSELCICGKCCCWWWQPPATSWACPQLWVPRGLSQRGHEGDNFVRSSGATAAFSQRGVGWILGQGFGVREAPAASGALSRIPVPSSAAEPPRALGKLGWKAWGAGGGSLFQGQPGFWDLGSAELLLGSGICGVAFGIWEVWPVRSCPALLKPHPGSGILGSSAGHNIPAGWGQQGGGRRTTRVWGCAGDGENLLFPACSDAPGGHRCSPAAAPGAPPKAASPEQQGSDGCRVFPCSRTA